MANGGTGAMTADGALASLGAQKRVVGSCDGGAISAIGSDGTVACLRKQRYVAPGLLPSAAADGDEVDYVADPQGGVVWRFRYNAGAVSLDGGAPYRWELVGGSELEAEVAASAQVAARAYDAGPQSGPVLTVPLNGEYALEQGYSGNVSVGTNGVYAYLYMSPSNAGAMASDDDAVVFASTAVGAHLASVSRTMVRAYVPGSLSAQYRTDNSGLVPEVSRRWMRIRPIRVR